jgi:hypothetical protein
MTTKSRSRNQMQRWLAQANARDKARARDRAESQRRHTQAIVNQMAAESTPQARILAAKSRAAAVYAAIDAIAAQSDLEATESKDSVDQHPDVPLDLASVRIDDLPTLFAYRDFLPLYLRERIKKIHAKINWQTRKGQKGYFNTAVHENGIPIDKALTILAHLYASTMAVNRSWTV